MGDQRPRDPDDTDRDFRLTSASRRRGTRAPDAGRSAALYRLAGHKAV